MRPIFSARAERDLEEIGDWISSDNPERAITFVQELRAACRALPEFPSAYPLAPEFGAGIRKRVHGDYLILDRAAKRITIVSIRHAARDRHPLSSG